MTKKCKVLVVEDNLSEWMLLRVAMEDSGLEDYVEAYLAKDASITLKDVHTDKLESYNMLLLDLNMPKVHGKEILQAMNERSWKVKPQVFIFSNSNNGKDINECYELGANAYIRKPGDYDKLVAMCHAIKQAIIVQGCICSQYIAQHYPILVAEAA